MALTDNITACWHFDESSGNAADSVGSRTATNQNTVTYSAGKFSNAATFAAASSQYFTFTKFDPGSSAFSIAFWFKYTGTIPPSVYPCIISQWDETGGDREWAVAIVGSNMYFYVADSGSTSNTLASTTTLVQNTTYFCVCTKSGTTGKIYINASLEGTKTTFVSTVVSGSASPRIGHSYRFGNKSDNYWNGQIDELTIWSRELSSTEVTTLYNGGTGLAYPYTATNNGAGFFALM